GGAGPRRAPDGGFARPPGGRRHTDDDADRRRPRAGRARRARGRRRRPAPGPAGADRRRAAADGTRPGAPDRAAGGRARRPGAGPARGGPAGAPGPRRAGAAGDTPQTETTAQAQAPFGLSTIGQILVPVRDVEAAAAFYRDALGLPFLFAFPGMAFFDAGGVRLYLGVPESPEFGGPITLYFRVL